MSVVLDIKGAQKTVVILNDNDDQWLLEFQLNGQRIHVNKKLWGVYKI